LLRLVPACPGPVLPETFKSLSFVLEDVENGEEFGDLHQVADAVGEVEELKLAVLVSYGGIR
jgi:hypothetical protein